VDCIFPLPVFKTEALATAFRREVGPELAGLYGSWFERHRARRDKALQRGDTLALIPVDRERWFSFCQIAGVEPDLQKSPAI
jgi:hypothetical protein